MTATASVLVIHILLAVALIAVILFQRSSSDGGAALGGGGTMGGLMSVRGTANLLTRITSFLATGFIVTSILLTILAGSHSKPRSIVDQLGATPPATSGTPQAPATPAVPMSK